MWLITTRGFYSVVEHRDDPDLLLVRARTREDLEALRDVLPDLDVFSDPSADYRWRALVPRGAWQRAVAQLVAEIDYGNFKSGVAQRAGHERAALYADVWATLLRLQTGAS